MSLADIFKRKPKQLDKLAGELRRVRDDFGPGAIFGGVGVLGPAHMDYPGTIASVAAVARYVGEVLGER